MSYQQAIQGQGSIRNSTDSRDSYRGSFRPSVEGRDSCTTFGTQVIIDKIYTKINEMEKTNQKIKQQLMGLSKISKDTKADLQKFQTELTTKQAKRKGMSTKQKQSRQVKAEKREERHRAMRQGINDMFTEQMKTGSQISNHIKTIHEDNDKVKFEHILQKKYANVEMLGKILIQQEREYTVIYKQQNKLFKKMGIGKTNKKQGDKQYELASLLNESSSGDEQDSDESDDPDEEDAIDNDLVINFDEDIESGGPDIKQQLLEQIADTADQQKLEAFEIQMNSRTEQIGNVTESIGKIQDMFKSLNEIVGQQGYTLTRLEDNVMDSRANTQDTVTELKETLKNEAPTLQERISQPIGSDLSTTCVMLWFFFAFVMFLIDFQGTSTAEGKMMSQYGHH